MQGSSAATFYTDIKRQFLSCAEQFPGLLQATLAPRVLMQQLRIAGPTYVFVVHFSDDYLHEKPALDNALNDEICPNTCELLTIEQLQAKASKVQGGEALLAQHYAEDGAPMSDLVVPLIRGEEQTAVADSEMATTLS